MVLYTDLLFQLPPTLTISSRPSSWLGQYWIWGMWHAAKDHLKINEGEGKEKYGTIDKRLKSQAFHVCIRWVRIPLVSPLEFGRTLHNKQNCHSSWRPPGMSQLVISRGRMSTMYKGVAMTRGTGPVCSDSAVRCERVRNWTPRSTATSRLLPWTARWVQSLPGTKGCVHTIDVGSPSINKLP